MLINKINTTVYLLFSGYNNRAVVALCRFFSNYNLPFAIIASSQDDIIFKSAFYEKIIYCRLDKSLDLNLFERVRHSFECKYGTSINIVYCPTSEYMNKFVQDNRFNINKLGMCIHMVNKNLYFNITNKETSQTIVHNLVGLESPPIMDWINLKIPCVFKPKKNIDRGRTHYPRICLVPEDLVLAKQELDSKKWFVQSYIDGQSYYLCGYLSKAGVYAHYWQVNFLQQPGGKSIVLAKIGDNPGLDADELFYGLSCIGYFGPFMMEVIQDKSGKLYYIEVNPRFWGPLQLALDARPEVLELFAKDTGSQIINSLLCESRSSWYAWAEGAQLPNCKIYPAMKTFDSSEVEKLLVEHDIYGRDDSQFLLGYG